MPAKLKPEDFAAQVRAKHGDNIVLLSDYVSYGHPIRARCETCEHEWNGSAEWLRRGGCPKCACRVPRTTASYAAEVVAKFGPVLEMLSEYGGIHTPIRFRCVAVGHEFDRTPNCMSNADNACPFCYHEGRRLTTFTEARLFRNEIIRLTERNYALYRRLINPKGYRRSKTGWHLDHIYSIHDAYYNPKGLKHPITPAECAHPANLRLLGYLENHRKQKQSALTATELRRRIADFNRTHGFAW